MPYGSDGRSAYADRLDSRSARPVVSGPARILKRTARLAPLGMCFVLLCAALMAPAPAAGQEGAQEVESINVPAEFARGRVQEAERKLLTWLAEGGDPNWAIDPNKNAFVHYAAGISTYSGNILAQTIASGGDCSLRNAHGESPLHWAAAGQDLAPGPATAGLLLRCGADPNARDNYGNTPLLALYVSVYDPPPGVPLPVNDIRGKHSERESFLMGGARVDILRLLLGAGADANTRNNIGDRPLMIAVGSKDVALSIRRRDHLELLLGAGADPNARGPGRNNFGSLTSLVVTPLIQALLAEHQRHERLAIMTLLLEARADPNRRDDAGDAPLAHAINRLEYPSATIKFLLDGGADPDLRNGSGETPLMQAVLELEAPSAAVKALLEGGANPCLRGRDGKLPSYVAESESETWRLLVNAGGFMDLDTGVCMHDARKAAEKEKALGLSRDARRGIQSCLKTQGFDPGSADGLFGPRTRAAIRSWQAAQGQDSSEAAGHISSQDQLDGLLAGCRVTLEPLCTGEMGTPCWRETANQPGCHIWNPYPKAEETVTWSGRCVDGKSSGKGSAVWRYRQDGRWKTTTRLGQHREGKTYGHLVAFFSSTIWEGPTADGKWHGRWVRRGSFGKDWLCYSRGKQVDRDHSLCRTATSDQRLRATEGVRLRSGPGDEYEEIGRIHLDDTVKVTGEAPPWAWIETESGKQGFALLSALEAAEVAIVTEPKCAYGVDENGYGLLSNDEYSKLTNWESSGPWPDGYAAIREKYLSLGIVYDKCWLPVKNIPKCYIFLGVRFPDGYATLSGYPVDGIPPQTFEWTGMCNGGVVNGNGTIKNKWGYLEEAHFVNGKRHERVAREDKEGGFVNGLAQGKWIFRQHYEEKTWINNFEDGLYHGEQVEVVENYRQIKGCTLVTTSRFSHGRQIGDYEGRCSCC